MHSWVESANQPGHDFPLENLPFCRFRRDGQARIGVQIGDSVLDLSGCADWLKVPGLAEGNLNLLAAWPHHAQLRAQLTTWLSEPESPLKERPQLLTEVSDYLVPFEVGDYTDFYASIHHATRVGSMFRPDQPLLPNYKHVPIGYHGRASTLVVSGSPVRRPSGQTLADGATAPTFGPCKLLDYELEMGFWVGAGNETGCPLSLEQAETALFGVSLVNDWSARDIQKWEYQPLGPFLAKSFATSVSPWVVTTLALEPYRCAPSPRPQGDPEPLPYLSGQLSTFDIQVEVWLSTQRMRDEAIPAVRVSRSALRDLYWTPAQLLTHHASNGCWMKSGDLLASGTISGPEKESSGCLLERTWQGAGQPRLPLTLGGEQRSFLADGDEVTLRGYAEAPGRPRIGLGECRGVVLPAWT